MKSPAAALVGTPISPTHDAAVVPASVTFDGCHEVTYAVIHAIVNLGDVVAAVDEAVVPVYANTAYKWDVFRRAREKLR